MLALLAVLSMAVGNITAIAQTNIKRMLAYSTIAHMGFMLLGLLSGVVGGNLLNAASAYSAAMFYVIVYVLMSLGSFGMVLLLSRAGFDCENLDDFKGLNRRTPWYAFLMLLLMFSLAGLPPTAGFYAKLAVLQSAVAAGQIWLAVAAVVFSLIGAFYYLRIVKLMYFDEPKDTVPLGGSLGMRVLISANGLALLVLGILPQPLLGCAWTRSRRSEKRPDRALRLRRDRSTTACCSRCIATRCACPTAARRRASTSAIPGAVAIVPLFDDGSVLLERQFRYPHRREFIEIPAGKLDPGEPHLATARRELLEETGYAADEWTAPRRDPHRHRLHGRGDRAVPRAQAAPRRRQARPRASSSRSSCVPFDEALAHDPRRARSPTPRPSPRCSGSSAG